MDTIKQHKFFTIFQFDKEEEYLSQCHKKGLAFQRLGFIGTYIFEKVEPSDMTYKLEFTADIKD